MNSFKPASLDFSRKDFSEVARNMSLENDQFGKGAVVLPPATNAYRNAWHRYKVLAQDTLSVFGKEEKTNWDVVAELIDDDIRTILMARGIRRAIEKLLKETSSDIHVIEAGFGTGFMAAIALAQHPRVKLTGYDLQPSKIAVAENTCNILGLPSERFSFQEQNIAALLEAQKQPNVLMVAEHVSAGLMHELTTDIPRSFLVNPVFAIPYAVYPQLSIGTKTTVVHGEEIILADPKSKDEVSIRGITKIPARSRHPLSVGNGIRWSGIQLPGTPAIEQRNLRTVDTSGKRNHLLRYTNLHADTDSEKNMFWWIMNEGTNDTEVEITLSYPVGFLVNKKAKPSVAVDGHKNIKVYEAPLKEDLFLAYIQGMKRGETGNVNAPFASKKG